MKIFAKHVQAAVGNRKIASRCRGRHKLSWNVTERRLSSFSEFISADEIVKILSISCGTFAMVPFDNAICFISGLLRMKPDLKLFTKLLYIFINLHENSLPNQHLHQIVAIHHVKF